MHPADDVQSAFSKLDHLEVGLRPTSGGLKRTKATLEPSKIANSQDPIALELGFAKRAHFNYRKLLARPLPATLRNASKHEPTDKLREK